MTEDRNNQWNNGIFKIITSFIIFANAFLSKKWKEVELYGKASPKAGLFSLAFRSLAYLCPSVGIMGSLAGECSVWWRTGEHKRRQGTGGEGGYRVEDKGGGME